MENGKFEKQLSEFSKFHSFEYEIIILSMRFYGELQYAQNTTIAAL
jgi:hypothetical protein